MQLRASISRPDRRFLHASLAPAAQNPLRAAAHGVHSLCADGAHNAQPRLAKVGIDPSCLQAHVLFGNTVCHCAQVHLGPSMLACSHLTHFCLRFSQAQVPKKRTENEPALLDDRSLKRCALLALNQLLIE